MPRPKKTTAEINTMRERVIDSTLDLLNEKGLDGISSRMIAKRLGISHMSLFTYFENQADIQMTLRKRLMSDWSSRFDGLESRALTENIPELVAELCNMLITYARENPNLYRLAWIIPDKKNPLSKGFKNVKLIAAEPLADLLKIGMERGDFTKRDPMLAATTVLGMVHMPFILCQSGRIDDPIFRDRLVEEALSIVNLYLLSN